MKRMSLKVREMWAELELVPQAQAGGLSCRGAPRATAWGLQGEVATPLSILPVEDANRQKL